MKLKHSYLVNGYPDMPAAAHIHEAEQEVDYHLVAAVASQVLL